MSFQRTVMIVSVIILIVSLVLIGIALYKQKFSDVEFPPVVADCPDYWTNVSKDNMIKCSNTKKLGMCHDDMNFSLSGWSNASGLCEKSKWAKDCGITWDGVTNNPKACETF